MHRIGIDCRFASGLGGLGTYTRGIVRALLARDEQYSFTLFVTSKNQSWLSLLPRKSSVTIVEAPFKQYSFREQWQFPSLIRASGCDLFYSPHFNVPLWCPVPFIATVHDLILHRYPNQAGFLKRLVYRFVFSSAVKHACAVVAVSESTKRDLAQLYPHVESKTIVSFPGIDEVLTRASDDGITRIRERYDLQKPFLLYIGNCKEHKNVPVLLEAFTKARLAGIDLVLVCSGKECDTLELPQGVRRISNVQDTDFSALYSAALGLVTATLAEGFGLPMVEAMACGTPVLATTCGSIPEVCGSHALLVEPTATALAEGMKRMMTDPDLRSSVRLKRAKEWSGRYDWDKAAAVLSSQIAKILADSHGN